KLLLAKGSWQASQTATSILSMFYSFAVALAMSSMFSERSVKNTFPCLTSVASVNHGSPVPEAISNTLSVSFKWSACMVSRVKGFKVVINNLSHFFHIGENLFQVDFWSSRILLDGVRMIM